MSLRYTNQTAPPRWVVPPPPEELAPDGLPVTLPNGFTRRQIAEAISPRIQELILLPTEKCNFRCTYCYEDFELGKMSEETQRAIELFIDKRMEGLELLKFSWFGGEPLVAKDVVLRLSRYAKQKCDEHGVKFQGGLTTNAYALDQALARELISLNQDFFQITLDGWKEAHDLLRQRADGRGTFDVIWQNLLGLKALDLKFEVCVRIHVRRDNIENLEILMREYAKEFFDDKRFRLDFQHLRNMGGDGGKTIENVVTLQELNQIEEN
ncbi:MAG: radical SAM protein [Burkholderiales bacterium]